MIKIINNLFKKPEDKLCINCRFSVSNRMENDTEFMRCIELRKKSFVNGLDAPKWHCSTRRSYFIPIDSCGTLGLKFEQK